MTTKTLFASSRIILLGLTASLVSLSAQADIVGINSLPAPASSTFATSIGNVNQAVDNTAALGLLYPARAPNSPTLVEIDVQDLERWRARILDAISLGHITDDIVNPVLNTTEDRIELLSHVFGDAPLPLNAGQAAGSVLRGVSDTVGNVGDLVRNNPDNPSPINSTLTDLTGSLVNATGALLQGGVQAPANNGMLNGLASNNPGNANLLSPVTNLVNAAGEGLLDIRPGNSGLLAPVGNLLGGLTGGLPNTPDSNNGLLTPVTGLVTGLLGNISTSPVNTQASLPADSSTTTAANSGLLAPVTGLVSGLLGGAPH